MRNRISNDRRTVTDIRRKAGGLRRIETSSGHRYLVIKNAKTEHLLQVGTEVGEEDIELIEGPTAMEAGMRLAKNLLSSRDRTEREIRNALFNEGVEKSEVIDYIVELLIKHGYLDDRRLTVNFIRYRMEHRPSGPVLLRKKLLAAGVGEGIIDEELDRFFGEKEEMDIAVELVLSKFSSNMEPKRLVRKVNGFLSRRGFTSETVNSICSKILRKELLAGGNE